MRQRWPSSVWARDRSSRSSGGASCWWEAASVCSPASVRNSTAGLVRDVRRDLGPLTQIELAHDVLDVDADGAVGDEQAGSDLLVRQPATDELGDLAFAVAQRARCVRPGRPTAESAEQPCRRISV